MTAEADRILCNVDPLNPEGYSIVSQDATKIILSDHERERKREERKPEFANLGRIFEFVAHCSGVRVLDFDQVESFQFERQTPNPPRSYCPKIIHLNLLISIKHCSNRFHIV